MDKTNYKKLWGDFLTSSQREKVLDAIVAKGDLETLKWLWGQYLLTNQRDKVLDGIISRADLETLKWLWGQYLLAAQRERVLDAIVAKGDLETLKWLWGQYLLAAQRDKVLGAITNFQNKSSGSKGPIFPSDNRRSDIKNYEYDFFISHASEDKESFVRSLAKKLRERGFKVWYDEFTLTLGDSLREKIDYGLANSCFGIVVLSKYFFEKDWPKKELDGLVARERNGKKVILPIWHGVTRKDVEKFSPILAGRVAARTNKGLDCVIDKIIKVTKQV